MQNITQTQQYQSQKKTLTIELPDVLTRETVENIDKKTLNSIAKKYKHVIINLDNITKIDSDGAALIDAILNKAAKLNIPATIPEHSTETIKFARFIKNRPDEKLPRKKLADNFTLW